MHTRVGAQLGLHAALLLGGSRAYHVARRCREKHIDSVAKVKVRRGAIARGAHKQERGGRVDVTPVLPISQSVPRAAKMSVATQE